MSHLYFLAHQSCMYRDSRCIPRTDSGNIILNNGCFSFVSANASLTSNHNKNIQFCKLISNDRIIQKFPKFPNFSSYPNLTSFSLFSLDKF